MRDALEFKGSNVCGVLEGAAFSASSRLLDLNGEANRLRKKQSSAIISADVRRFGHVINKDGVLGTHRLTSRFCAMAEVKMAGLATTKQAISLQIRNVTRLPRVNRDFPDDSRLA
jgi:hypothetical protein